MKKTVSQYKSYCKKWLTLTDPAGVSEILASADGQHKKRSSLAKTGDHKRRPVGRPLKNIQEKGNDKCRPVGRPPKDKKWDDKRGQYVFSNNAPLQWLDSQSYSEKSSSLPTRVPKEIREVEDVELKFSDDIKKQLQEQREQRAQKRNLPQKNGSKKKKQNRGSPQY